MHAAASPISPGSSVSPAPPDAKPFDLQTATLTRREHIALVMDASNRLGKSP
jgi:hypothetical protein